MFLGVPVMGQTFSVVHSFTPSSGPNAANSDGAYPAASLLLSGNTLYGTAMYGGSAGNGTVFAVNLDGTGFTAIYNFTGGGDGANSSAELVLLGNTLYGTASLSGNAGGGTLFGVSIDGTIFSSLHSFGVPVNDGFGILTNSGGAFPSTGLLLAGNILYGAANNGGTAGRGTLFSIGADGSAFTTLHNFSSGSGGAYASAGLILSGGMLNGTDYGNLGSGTVFAISTTGTGFTNNYAFTSGHLNAIGILTNSDGANPHAKLLLSGNTFYGTATYGGSAGNGTVFAVNPDGSGFRTLHNFLAGGYNTSGFYTNSDGATPAAGLITQGNTLYGTTSTGGSAGNGTVFAVNMDGTGFMTLYSFSATPQYPAPQTNSDGATPSAGLVLAGYTLFGTAAGGGNAGNGTIFSLSFAPSLSLLVLGTNLVITWPANLAGFDYTGFVLQSAPEATGPFATISGATNPYTNAVNAARQYYRLSR